MRGGPHLLLIRIAALDAAAVAEVVVTDPAVPGLAVRPGAGSAVQVQLPTLSESLGRLPATKGAIVVERSTV